MARKLIHDDPSNVGRLHCDECGYDLPEAKPYDEFASGFLIGYECPACGADMLTVRDWHDTMKMYRWVQRINKWFGWLGTEQPTASAVAIRAKVHNGKLEIKEGH